MLHLGRILPVLAPCFMTAVSAGAWEEIHRADLDVTLGSIRELSDGTLKTSSPKVRAVEKDGGRHARHGRIELRYLGESSTTEPLGSGLVRRQIGLKLRASDPCNLVYVMWEEEPTHRIVISVKRNPGQDSSSECGNNGYTTIRSLPLGIADNVRDHRRHTLEARTYRRTDGWLYLKLYKDGSFFHTEILPPELVAGLEGPVGVRSDNGTYEFRLWAEDRRP